LLTSRGKAAFSRIFGGGLAAYFFRLAANSATRGLIAPLSGSQSGIMILLTYVVYSSQFNLPSVIFHLYLECSALCGILSTGILSTCPNHQCLHWM